VLKLVEVESINHIINNCGEVVQSQVFLLKHFFLKWKINKPKIFWFINFP
jgi:hypothetical protein